MTSKVIYLRKSIKIKILSVFIFLFVLIGIISIWSIFSFNTLSRAVETIMEANYRSVVATQNMIVALERQDSAELANMFVKDEPEIKPFIEFQNHFLKAFSVAENNITEDGEKEIISSINSLYESYVEEFHNLVDIQNNSELTDVRSHYYNTVLPIFNDIKSACRELQNINHNAMLNQRNSAVKLSRSTSYSLLAIFATSIIVGLILVFYTTSKIVKPVYSLIEKTKRIVAGDYMQKLEVQGNDEIAELTQEFNTMAERLKAFERINIQKIMEEKHKAEAIVESISDAVLVTDKENKIISLNTAAEKALNVSRHEVLNKHILESIKNEDIFQIIKSIYDLDPMHKDSRYRDIEIKEGNETKHFRVKAKPIKDDSGKISGVVTLLMDITKFKKIDQMKSEFVSTVSHEFRTPLTSIGMSVELLLDQKAGKVNEKQVELLNAIKEDYERLRDLVSDLLDLSKIESGKIQMDIVKCDLNTIVENAIKPFDKQLDEKRAELSVNIPERISKIKADFNKISWVLTNLIGNAIRYIPDDDSGKIIISAKELSNKVLVSVSDNGKGIPEEMQERIFEKFVRADDQETKGTGLGLAISKEILIAHGGDIWVRSKPGEGSTFYFTLYTIS